MVTLTIDFSEVGRGGVREKVETTPNTLLSDVLKQAWVQASERGRRNSEDARALGSATTPPLPATWTLRYGQRLLDLSLPFRLSGLTGHARVVVVDRGTQEHTKPGRLDRARAGARVPTAASSSEALSVAVQFEDSSPGRSIVRASPEDTLWTVLLRADSERVWRYQPCLLIARYLESTYFGVAHFYNLRLRDLGLDAGMRPLIRIQCSGTDDDSAGWHTLAVASCASMASDGGSSADTVAKREVSEDSARRSDNSLGVAACVQHNGSLTTASTAVASGATRTGRFIGRRNAITAG
ncbi:hypothetical protein F1559_001209 [Cyanidiococcus yangmingshanensis]|uniref:TUG ubiquitin-like domain-containing protein n=1 Tax=Cyanidiococcus yangmingshanensis TaxID=2690220 RepID=A0A7J7IMZ3_9RHOD|nr:hypothetical protein F1559_001209 [Cyanidiococcus yangmingshanensis]